VVRAGLISQDKGPVGALVNTVMNLRVPQNAGKFLSIRTTGSLSRRAQLHAVSYVLNGLEISFQAIRSWSSGLIRTWVYRCIAIRRGIIMLPSSVLEYTYMHT
jgi:hypothetical protein